MGELEEEGEVEACREGREEEEEEDGTKRSVSSNSGEKERGLEKRISKLSVVLI